MRNSLLVIFGIACLLMAALGQSALALNEFQRFAPTDLSQTDGFGRSVGLSGNTAVVGAWRDDLPGSLDAGSAYIFRDAGTGLFSQLDKLTAGDAAANSLFGSSVAISGNTAIVGAPNMAGGGAAYIFRDNGSGDWVQIDKIVSSNAAIGDEFGYSVAIDGNTAVIGAWQKGGGSAYVFRDNGSGDWNQVGAPLVAGDAIVGDQFGASVGISGTTAFIGSPHSKFIINETTSIPAGSVYVFQDAGANWTQAAKLTPTDQSLAKEFGASVAVSGATAVIGGMGDSPNGAGSAYVFQNDGGSWQQQDKLTPSDPAFNGKFGISVGLSGNNVVVGANENVVGGNVVGAAYLYRNNGAGQWNQIRKLTPSDGQVGDWFGYSVVAAPTGVLVGSVFANDSVVGVDTGGVYQYQFPAPVLAGDYTHDGKVDGADYTLWRNSVNQAGPALAADGNGDGVVNNADYSLWKRNYGRTLATGSLAGGGTVPEPATVIFTVIATMICALIRRPRT